MRYSVTTVALPEYDLEGQVKLLKSLGYDGIEFRVRRNPAGAEATPWGMHKNDLSPDNLVSRAPAVRAVLADHGLALAALATYVPCTQLEEFKLILEGAVAVGAPAIRVGAAAGFSGADTDNYHAILGETIAGFARCLEISRGSGVKLIIETHGKTIHTSASLAYRIVSNFSASDIGVIFDPNNMVSDGFETTGVAIPLLGGYLAHCHLAGHLPVAGEPDENGTVPWKWICCDLEKGLYNCPEMLRWLKRCNYQGFISIEDFRMDIPAETRFAQAIQYLKKIEPK